MSKLSDLSRLARIYGAYRRRTEVCDYPPTRVWVEATSHCNLSCSFCGNRELTREQRGFMDMSLFRRIADEASGSVGQFNLFHRGESLLHPQIGVMVRYACEKGIRTRMNTNATRLDRDKGRELICSGLDMLSFSFDGYDREMYEKNRKNASFDQTMGNVLGFLELKKEAGARKPFVSIEVMEIANRSPQEFEQDRKEFLRRFEGLPLDKFVIRRPHNWAGLVKPERAARQAWKQTFIPCPLLWHALVVFWDGSVLPCPQDFFGALKLGDLRNERLEDIWKGEALRELRREMRKPQMVRRKPCVDCDRILRATIAGIPVDYLGRFLSESILGNSKLSRLLPH